MPLTMLTPVEFGSATQAGASLWRKQLLPLGEITYKGRKIAFTKDYLAGLVKAFRDRSYDVVPFQFADSANSHSNAPEQRRGTVRDLLLTDDGLDLILEAGETASKHLSEYPDLGVSARIVEGYDRADGKFFPAAIQHVLGTLDPRIPGMRPWQAVEAANDDAGDVIDLTDAGATAQPKPPEPPSQPEPAPPAATSTEENPMALTEAQEARLKTLLDLPEEKFSALLADPEPDAEMTDAELDALLAEIDAEAKGEDAPEGEPAPEPEPATAGASLSAEDQAALELANARAEQNAIDLARVTAALDLATYERERDTLARVHGIPPRITDLARPLLEGTGRTVELANGANVDAGSIMRKVLAEVGKTVKMLDLTAELGNPGDSAAQAEAEAEAARAAERSAITSAYRQMAGI